jgi:hypothetical protein
LGPEVVPSEIFFPSPPRNLSDFMPSEVRDYVSRKEEGFLSEEPFEGMFPNNPPFYELPRLSTLVGSSGFGIDFPQLG